ncbi:MAG TPA: hypothetical protein VE442_24120 [Jatrophihabitans sp.]|jgi:hypothetical protein|nr:hypothetical protein [Jatrophihabitans sp.]
MAQHVLTQLAQPAEYEPAGGGLLVDPFVPEDARYPGGECFKVSFGTRDGGESSKSLAPATQDSMTKSMAWAAGKLADAFQDEVIELLDGGDPRPVCPGHAHPMAARVADSQAWWECPTEPTQRRPLWPT